ncbi:MAG TPA: hypothetical protein VMY43_01750 [Methanothrix sp.]|jgi:hypothetical protein|nr:hypothetical protein [Methanothrix sp.]
MEPRILKIGEIVTGKYRDMVLGRSKKSFLVKLDNEEFYLPKDVGNSLLMSRQKGFDRFTIQRQLDVYEIRPHLQEMD